MPSSRLLVPSLVVLASPMLAMDWPGIDLHGFVSQGYLNSSGNNFVADSRGGTWAYSEVGLNVSSQVTDKLRVGAQLFAYDLGDFGNHEILVDWAYGDYRHNDYLGLRAGRYKLPLGLYNEVLDLDLATPTVLLPQAVYDARYRDILGGMNGIQVYGMVPTGGDTALDYQVFIGTTNIDEDGYLALQFQQGSQAYDTVESMTVGTIGGAQLVWWPGITGLRGLAAVLYAQDLEATGTVLQNSGAPFFIDLSLPIVSYLEDLIIANFGVEYVADQLTLAAEYRLQYGDINGQVDASAVGGGTIPFTQLARSDGGYVQAAYRLDDRWEIGSYYGVYYGNRNDREGDNLAAIGQERWLRWQKDLALTIRCDINEYWVVKVEGHYLDGVAMLAPSENPNGYEQHWFMFAAKTTVSF